MFYTNLIILIHIILWFSNITKKKQKQNTKETQKTVVILLLLEIEFHVGRQKKISETTFLKILFLILHAFEKTIIFKSVWVLKETRFLINFFLFSMFEYAPIVSQLALLFFLQI